MKKWRKGFSCANVGRLKFSSPVIVQLCDLTFDLSIILQRHLVDRAYYIAKELLMTERTYKKDLEVITMVMTMRS